MFLNNIYTSRLAYSGKSLLEACCKCSGILTLNNQQHRKKSDAHEAGQMKEASAPSATWSAEAVDLYNKLVEETSGNGWQKIHRMHVKGKTRPFLRATGDNMFAGAIFVNKSERIAKGLITFGPWCEGGPGHVHGGAVATVHDSIIGVLANTAVGPSVTANLNTNFRSPLRLNKTTLITGRIESVVGRKIRLTSQIMSPDEKILYGDATALFLLLDRE